MVQSLIDRLLISPATSLSTTCSSPQRRLSEASIESYLLLTCMVFLHGFPCRLVDVHVGVWIAYVVVKKFRAKLVLNCISNMSASKITRQDGKKGKSTKQQRKKKVPQRGLGVAQLEKIRLEEQQKREALAGPSSCFMVPIHPNFKAAMAIPSFELFTPCPSGDVAATTMWFPSPGGGGSGLLQNSPPLKSSSMVKASSSLSMEPPSNQRNVNCSNSALPTHNNKEKIVGMKRPWPFSHDNPPGKDFSPSKLPAFHPSLCRWNDSSNRHLGKLKLEQGTANKRGENQCPSSSSNIAHCKEPKVTNGNKRDGSLDGAFLTLTTPRQEEKKPLPVPCRGSMHGESTKPICSSQPGRERQTQVPFYSFLPVKDDGNAETPNGRTGDEAEILDLRLKI